MVGTLSRRDDDVLEQTKTLAMYKSQVQQPRYLGSFACTCCDPRKASKVLFG